MSDSPLTLQQAADELGVHYMTAYKYVRTGRLSATRVGGRWMVERGDIRALDAAVLATTGRVDPVAAQERFTARLVAGDELGAWQILEARLASGSTALSVQDELIVPALAAIGDSWAQGTLSVADEHVASNVVLRLLGRLGPLLHRRGRTRGAVLIGAPEADLHSLPGLLLAGRLWNRSFSAICLGADTPARSFCDRAGGVDVIAVSVTTPGNEGTVRDLTAQLRESTSAAIVVGGPAVTSEELAAELGSEVFASPGQDPVELFVSLLGSVAEG